MIVVGIGGRRNLLIAKFSQRHDHYCRGYTKNCVAVNLRNNMQGIGIIIFGGTVLSISEVHMQVGVGVVEWWWMAVRVCMCARTHVRKGVGNLTCTRSDS